MKKNKLAFTLSELLVAMSIIGILTLILTPVIGKIMPDKNKVMIKRSYYVITNTVKDMINDTDLYSPFGAVDTEDETTLVYRGKEFTNKNTVNYEGISYSGDSKFRKLFIAKIGGTNSVDASHQISFSSALNSSDTIYSNSGTQAVTKDGIMWTLVDTPSNDSRISIILVDVNGEKAPNCYQGPHGTCTSRTKDFDQYVVGVYNDGVIEISSKDAWAKSIINSAGEVNGD